MDWTFSRHFFSSICANSERLFSRGVREFSKESADWLSYSSVRINCFYLFRDSLKFHTYVPDRSAFFGRQPHAVLYFDFPAGLIGVTYSRFDEHWVLSAYGLCHPLAGSALPFPGRGASLDDFLKFVPEGDIILGHVDSSLDRHFRNL